jgi:hypothetical protein
MALTYSNFSTFAEVVTWYERTKPLRGEANKDKNIRPLGDRSRKWERIVKIDDNCYALSDGYHYGDDIFRCWYRNTEYNPTPKDMAFYAPIVWRKHKDGTETVTLRNGAGPGLHTSRYQFLWRHTPNGLGFTAGNRDGKQYITVNRGTPQGKIFLAKGTTVPRPVWEDVQNELAKRTGNHVPRWIGWQRVKDDGVALTFKRTDKGWEFASGGKPIPAPLRKRVDLDIKAKLKPHIDAFREWLVAIGPLIPMRDYQYERSLRDSMQEWIKETTGRNVNVWSVEREINCSLARKIIANSEHPLRMHLAYVVIRYTDFLTPCEDEDDVRMVKAAFNRWVNKQLGLIKEVKG